MEKPTTFKSVKTVFTLIRNMVSDTQNQFEKLEASFAKKQVMQPLFLKAIQSKKTFLGLVLFLCFSAVNAQTGTAFSARLTNGSIKVKGDIILIGNTAINKVNDAPTPKPKPNGWDGNPAVFSPSAPKDGVKYTGTVTNLGALTTEANLDFNGVGNNNNFFVEYSDIDSDASTFNSTSADLLIDNPCKSIVFAGLYWSAIYPYERSTNTTQKYEGSLREDDWNKVKFKVPNGSYVDLTASKTDKREVIFDGYKLNGSNVSDSFKDSPYVCFKDVTTLLQGVKNKSGQLDADGTYTVANIRAARGKRNGGGAGGWTLVVIYESPSLPSKFISVFDGYVGVDPGTTATKTVSYKVSGFQTLPKGFPVYAKIGVGALEGDNQIYDDDFQIKADLNSGYTKLSDAANPIGNFFNASISNNGVSVQNRNPKSTNTMGIDIDNVTIPWDKDNPVIPNDEKGATLLLSTDGDGYGAYVTTFAVDIIEPKIILTKVAKGVKMVGGVETEYDLGGLPVNLGQEIRYVIGFRNQGNDNAKDFTITDVLPVNVIFDPATDLLITPKGVTFVSYTPATRTLVYKVDDNLVVKSGPTTTLEIRVRVVNDCNELMDACSNLIQNTAVSRYFGDKSPTNNGQPYGDGSYSFDTGCIVGDPTSTNFLVGVDKCRFNRDVSLCGSAVLTAALGYGSYAWKAPDGSNAGNTRSITVTKAGIYTVQTGDSVDGKCKGIVQTFDVKDHIAGANNNPVSEYADNIDPVTKRPYTCTRDNIEFPKIFLCGANDKQLIDTHISQATSIIWQETKDVPPTGFPASCPYDTAPNWVNVGTPGPTFMADRAGAFRVVITYGNNCVNTFYFSVFQNPLDPKADKLNIVCNTKGTITVTNPPINTGYTYSLDNVNGTYQASNIFNNVAAGSHTVYIKQNPAAGETSFCPFFVNVTILKETFAGTVTTTDPLCPGDLGSMTISGDGLSDGNYQFIVKKAGTSTVVADSGIISSPNYVVFDQKFLPGKYDVEITSPKYGCSVIKKNIEIFDKKLTATANVSKTLACGDGEITINVSGGTPIPGATPSYYYTVNGVNLGQLIGNQVKLPVTRPLPPGGTYDIVVKDYNSCSITLPTLTVVDTQKPTATINQKNVRCYNSKEGEISITVVPATSGYAVTYSVNGGAYTSLPTTGLDPGKYSVVVKYTYGTEDCFDTAQEITITGPTDPLLASGGVAELSGCGPAGSIDQGLVRITNAQGGVPFPAPDLYRYSFDGGLTWTKTNQAYVNPSTTPYTLLIKDAADCIFSIPGIVLQQKPADPEFKVSTPTYTCDGKGTVTVSVTTDPSVNYTYSYYLGKFNGTTYDYTLNTNTPANIFKDIPAGDYKVKVEYNLVTAATYSNLLREDFGSGPPTTTPGIATAYCFNDQRVNPPYLCKFPDGTPSRSVEDNAYSVASFFWRSDDPSNNNSGAWFHFKDHTTNPNNLANTGDPNGRFLLVNIGSAAGPNGVLYSKPIHDVIPNQPIQVDIAVANLLRKGKDGDSPSVLFQLVDPSGKVVSSYLGGTIAGPINDANREKWVTPPTISLNPGANTDLTFVIRSGSVQYGGNDIVIDDIWVRQLPKSCLNAKVLDLKVEDSKAFTVLEPVIGNIDCTGGKTGTITITAQNFNGSFYYSIDGGAKWSTSTTSPVIIDKLTAKSYTVIVKSDAAGTCSKSFTKVIGQNEPVTVTATVTTLPTCTSGATITAEAKGGVGPYTYALKLADGVTDVPGNGFDHSAIFTGVTTGTYKVIARDSKGCTSGVSTAVVVDTPVPPTASLDITSDLCYDSTNKATLVVKASGTGILNYSLDGGDFDTNNTFTNVGVGTHSVVVRDGNNCTFTINGIVINDELTAGANVTKTLDCISAGATIKVDIKGGKAPFTYKVKLETTGTYSGSVNVTGNTFNYPAAGAGNYYFEITDSNSPKACTIVTSATVLAIGKPVADATPTQVTCFGGSNGEVTVSASGGSGSGYSYSFNGSGFTSTIKYTGLKAGILYKYQVKDDKGCISDEKSITLTEPTAITGSIKTTDIQCGATATVPAVVTITAGGGTAPYKYSFTGPSNYGDDNTYSTTVSGVVKGYIIDTNGCQFGPISVTVGTFEPITGIDIDDRGYDCSTTPQGGHVIIKAIKTGALTNVSYRIISGPAGYNTASNTTGDFQPLAPGSYTFEATDSKTKCTKTISYVVSGTSDITAGGSVLTTIKCNGDKGNIQFTVGGVKTSGYDYVITNSAGATIQQANGVPATTTTITVASALVADDYTITVTDKLTKCKAIYIVKLTQPAVGLSLTATASNITCTKFTSTITASPVGGTTAYKYAVVKQGAADPLPGAYNTGSATLTVNTASGVDLDWVVFVMDANGCTAKYPVKIAKDATPTITAKVDNQCAGSGNSFTITATIVTPGTGTLTYGINGVNGAFSTNNVFTVGPGTYTVWVKDGNLCPYSAPAVTVYDQLTAGTVVKELDCSTTTPTSKNATITVNPSGGLAPYKYEVSTNGGTSYSPMASNVYSTAVAGTFKIKVTDANLCTVVVTEIIQSISNPVASIVTQSNVSCNGKLDGSVTIKGTGGSGGYSYSNNATTGFGPSATFTGLGLGDYTFYVKDSKGCIGSVPVKITEPNALVISSTVTPFACSTTNTKVQGKVVINAPAGGTSPFQYSFNGGGYSGTNTLLVDDNGTNQKIDYAVKDANGCITTGSVTLLKLNPPVIDKVTPSTITCLAGATSSNVTVTLLAGTGVAALKYETIAPSQAIIAQQSSNVFNGLAAGSYTFKVTDANGCFDTKVITINAAVKIAISGNKNNDVKCKGESTGNGTFTISNVATPGDYTFVLTAGTLGTGTLAKSAIDPNLLLLKNVAKGSYTVEVTSNSTGCKNSTTIIIDEPVLGLSLTATASNITCNKFTSTITASPVGGTTAYKYAVVKQGAADPAVAAYAGGATLTVDTNSGLDLDWVVFVMDANGCTAKYPVKIVKDATPTITAKVDNQCAGSGNSFTITATVVTPGTGTLTYGINGVNGAFSTNNVFTVGPGTYTVWVKDGNQCPYSAPAVTVYDQLTATTAIKELDCSTTTPTSKNATITVTPTGGLAPYKYEVSTNGGTSYSPMASNVYSTAVAGTFKIKVTDANLCTFVITEIIQSISNPVASIVTQSNVSCNGKLDGSVTIKGTGGSGGYSYSDSATGVFGPSATFTGLGLGDYTFYVKDSKGCIGSVPVKITEPNPLVISSTVTPFACSTTNTKVQGKVVINAPAGGTSPFQYSFNGGGYSGTNTLLVDDNGTNQKVDYAVKDANGCITTGTVTLLKLNSPVIDKVTPSTITCLAGATSSNVTVTLLAGTGVAALKYETIAPSQAIIPQQSSNVFNGLAAGSYTFKVTDANGCFDTKVITINAAVKIAISGNKNNDVKCKGGSTGNGTFTISNVASPGDYTFVLTAGTLGTGTLAKSAIDPNLLLLKDVAKGSYTVEVTSISTGCKNSTTIIIDEPVDPLTATLTQVNANCKVGTSKVTINAAGGTLAYKYAFVHDGAPKGTLTSSNEANLDPAIVDWDAYVVDANGCEVKFDVKLATDAIPSVTATATNQCLGVGTYTITATALGKAPFTYSINGTSFDIPNTFTVTTAGTYNVWVKDANGCIAKTTTPVTVYDKLTITPVLDKDITCTLGSEAAKITLTIGGGSGSFTYSYTSTPAGAVGTFAGNVFTTSDAADYIFTVKDNVSNCTATIAVPVQITTPTPPHFTAPLPAVLGCFGDSSGSITVNIDPTKGVAPFVINVTNKATLQDYGTQTSGLPAAIYVVKVTDAKGCSYSEDIEIKQPTKIVVASHADPITCDAISGGVSKGNVVVDSVVGGTAPYTYYVTGLNGYNKFEPNNTGATSVTFNVVDFGYYTIRVVDANGCSVIEKDVLVASPVDKLDINIDLTTVNCEAIVGPPAVPAGGKAVVTVGSLLTGNGPYHFNIYTGPGQVFTADGVGGWIGEFPAVGSESAIFYGLTPGVTYTFIVYDEVTKCYYYQQADKPVPSNSTLSIVNDVAHNITCTNAGDGNVTFQVKNNYATSVDVSYQVYESFTNVPIAGASGTATIAGGATSTSVALGPLAVGTYYVLVKEVAGPNKGCSVVSKDFNIKQSPRLLGLTASATSIADCTNLGTISAQANDGTMPYYYQVVPSGAAYVDADWKTPNTFTRPGSVAGIVYDVYTKDAYGCIKHVPVTVYKYEDPKINLPAPICYDGNQFTITITGSVDPAIVGGATYSVDGSAFQTSPNFKFNAAKIYNLVIKDGKGCTANINYEVKPQLKLDVQLTKDIDCSGTPDAKITLTASGGYGPTYKYEYSANGGSWNTMPTNVLDTSVTGNYIFRATDLGNATTCSVDTKFTLDAIPAIVFTVDPIAVTCSGSSDGKITVNVTSGVGPYKYQLVNGATTWAFQDSNVFDNLPASIAYVVTVRDAKLCEKTLGATVGTPAPLTATSSITAKLLCTTNNDPTKAVVTVVGAGGTTPYQYSYDGGLTYSNDDTFETYAGIKFDVYVKDANGCKFTLTDGVNVPALDAPTDMDISGTLVFCQPLARQTSTVTIDKVYNGVGTPQYEILSPIVRAKQLSNVFAGLAPNNAPYVFQVTDANGCTYQESYIVKPAENITVSGTLVSDVTCNPGNNGEVLFTVGNFTGTYSYVLNAGAPVTGQISPTISVTGLTAASTQTITITDEVTGCTATTSVSVIQNAPLSLSLVTKVAENCDNKAKVQVVASGGVEPYQYSFVVSTATGPGTYTTSDTAFLSTGTSFNWKVYVKDANDCEITAPFAVSITKDAAPSIAMPASICYVGSDVVIDLAALSTVAVAPAKYTLNGVDIPGTTYTVKGAGTYVFGIVDGNGCKSNQVSFIVKPQVFLQADLDQDLTCAKDASIRLTPTGGTGTYTLYEVKINAGGYTAFTTLPYVATVDGTYTFRVTDSQGCPAVSNAVIVTPKTVPMASIVATDVICSGDSNGTVTVTASNGIMPYQYRIDGGVFQTSNVFKGLGAGLHNVEVKDAKECISVLLPITVGTPTPLSATSAITTKLLCTTSNAPTKAEVTITGVGGSTPYQYSYDGGLNYSGDNTYETYAGIKFDVYVKDANGCKFTLTDGVNVPALNAPTDMDISGTLVFCQPLARQTSTVTIDKVYNGVGTPQFEILSPIVRAKQPSNVFAGLAPNKDPYVFQVTDANGCTYQESYTVKEAINITVTAGSTTDVSCNGGANGSAKFNVDNFTVDYTAALIAGTGTVSIAGKVVTVTGLVAGPYTLEVTDNVTGCKKTASIVIGQPAVLDVQVVSQTAANCYSGAVVTVKGIGGTPKYQYAFVVSGATPASGDYLDDDFAVLDFAKGPNWDVYVRDANQICINKLPIIITKDDAPTIDLNKNIYCYTGGPVAIRIEGTTDKDIVNPPMYSIGNGYYLSPDFTLNAPGTYDFYIKDGNGCIAHAKYTLRQELLLQAKLDVDLNCTTNTATISLLATQGTGAGTYANFEYDLNNSGVYKPVTAQPFVTSTPGTYTFRVKDAQCSAVSVPVVVTPLTAPKFTTAQVHVKCQGDLNGSITVTATDGLAPYEYSINGGAFGSVNVFAGLKKGTYLINVRDAKKCLSTAVSVDINEPVTLTATNVVTPFTCSTTNAPQDAFITVTAHDGTGPYNYSFDNGKTFGPSPVFTMNASGTINYVVVDVNGCRASGSATVVPYTRPTDFKIAATPIYCNSPGGFTTISVDPTTIVGGVAPYKYAIVQPVASATSNTTGIFGSLLPNTYVIEVTDANGCSTLNSIIVEKASEINVDAQLVSDVLCNAGSTGSIAFTVSNYITATKYDFALNPNVGTFTQTGDVITYTGLTAGKYTFTVTDRISGCTDNVVDFTIKQPIDPLTFTATATNINCNNKNATITVEAIGGTKAYGYAAVISGAAAPTVFSPNKAIVVNTNNGLNMAWDVYVKDLNGCPAPVKIQNILLDPLPSAITANVTSQCANPAGTYEFTVSASGVAPLQYSIGGNFQTDPKFIVTAVGSYDITVKDGNGCTTTATAAVKIEGALDLQYTVEALPSCDFQDGKIVVKATGGSGNYKYSSGAFIPSVTGTTATFSNMPAGSHTIVVRDLTYGCTDTVIVELKKATEITGLKLTGNDVSCNGGSNGLIIVNLDPVKDGQNDNPVYKYTLTGTTVGGIAISTLPQESNVFDNLKAGDYTVLVTSGRGCHAQVDIRIKEPKAIVVNAPVVTSFKCTTGTNTVNFATITVSSVSEGSGKYVRYEFSRNGKVVQDSDSNVYTEFDLKGGSYTVRVFDDKGCEGSWTAPIIIDSFITMDEVKVDVVKPITCLANETIQVSVATTGGTPALLSYTLTGLNGTVFNETNPTGLFKDLAIGQYKIVIENPATGCRIEGFHIVNNPNTFALEASNVVNVTCLNDTNGSIRLTLVDKIIPADNSGKFNYTITHESGSVISGVTTSTVLDLSNLKAGKYSVVATLVGPPNCDVKTDFTIQGPTAKLDITVSKQDITCVANDNGEIQASATGGWDGDYLYKLDGPVSYPYGTESHFTKLTAGVYTVTVKDAGGCEDSDKVTLSIPTPITATIATDKTLLTCYNNADATITVTAVNGGSGNYTYTLHGTLADGTVIVRDAQPSKVFTGLAAGNYYVTVSDDWTCSGTSNTVTINQPNEVKAGLSIKTSETCKITPVITLTVSGGTAPYYYSADGITYSVASFNGSIDIPLPKTTAAVDYSFYVKDSKNCTSVLSNKVPFAPVPELEFEKLVAINVPCKGGSTGSIYAIATGGLGNYVYTLLNAAKLPITPAPEQLTPGTFTNLPIGDYYVSVNSVDCDQISELIKITEPAEELSAVVTPFDVLCAGFNNGKITIVAKGGTGTYTYAITPELEQSFDVPLFENLKPGNYVVRVQDGNICYMDYPVTINDATPLVVKELVDSQVPEYCFDDKDGIAFVEVTGGKGPYTASITGNGTTIDFRAPDVDANTFSFKGLLGGIEYVVSVKDANSCPQEVTIKLPEPVKLIPTIVEAYDCENDLPVNSITVTIEGNIAEVDHPQIVYTLLLDGVTTGVTQTGNKVFKNLPSGNYSVEATFANCTKRSNTITIKAVEPLFAVDVTKESKDINTIVVKASGGVAPYEYSFNGGPFTSSNSYQIYKTDVYKVIVRDQNGCQFYLDVPGEYIDICMPNYFTPGGATPTIGPDCGALAYKDLTFKIFDRYGRIVANYRVGQKWDGKYNGAELPTGDYWYVLKLNDEKDAREFVGHFTLYR